ncbi:MarC family protein [Sulfurimonas sp. HSL3-2]|uniref:MarC family protein n=1 Tax=Hydrocurvibacter mobilis TaxID=3131936 RepID=UPI0031F8E91B
MDFTSFIHIFITLISIMNPLGVIPIFLAITADQSAHQKRSSIKRTVTAVILILLISAYGGNYLLSFFGIDIDSFRIAGGILLLLMSVHMLQAKTPTVKTNENEQSEAVEKEDIAVVPLAIPLLAGPGSISTVILFSSSMPTLIDKLALGIIIAVSGLLILPTLLLSKPIGKRLGSTGLNIATRIMGLILASISVKFILEGVLHFLKGNI